MVMLKSFVHSNRYKSALSSSPAVELKRHSQRSWYSHLSDRNVMVGGACGEKLKKEDNGEQP